MMIIKKACQILCFLVCTFLLVQPCSATPLFVDAHWLSKHKQEVILLDARPYRNFFWSHIPGSFSAPWKGFTEQKMKMGDAGWGVLLPKQLLAEKIRDFGIQNNSQVVVYASYPGWGDDGQVAWTLKVAGLENVHILDGGLDAWKAMGGVTTMKSDEPEKSALTISWNKELVITTEEIVASKDLVLIDTRTKEEFEGAINYKEARGGHLPDAIHLPFTEMFTEDGFLKDSKDLEEIFHGHGLEKDDKIVTYCTAGIRSAYMTLVLRSFGYEYTKNYDAGFYEWARRVDLPLL